MINIITIEREYGSGAPTTGRLLANRLGWQLWDHEITAEIAKRLKCDVRKVEEREERPDPAYYRLLKAFMRGSYEDRVGSGGLDLLDADSIAGLFENIILDIAARGKCVIIGRGAPWFLRNRGDAFHLFLYAPHDEKMRRITASGRTEAEAEDLIERVDRERAAFVKKYYDMTWPTRHLYHLMVNSKVGDELVAELVLQEIAVLNRRNQPNDQTVAS
ncbi:MAG: cytidylate kinase-like family protein [Acidobacteriaceae bacterium]|nr:cytidylate kinase-like family protein [Acidobacteriaceae bacterium]